jgi:hypothetical protein
MLPSKKPPIARRFFSQTQIALQLVVDLDLGYRLHFVRQAGVDDNVTGGFVGKDYIDFCHSFLWLFFF